MIDTLVIPEAVQGTVNPLADIADRLFSRAHVNVLYVASQAR